MVMALLLDGQVIHGITPVSFSTPPGNTATGMPEVWTKESAI
jgi:hypothetical protein